MSSDNIRDHNSEWANQVSIPLEQGSVFRHITQATNVQDFLSQSLWNRAVSSDMDELAKIASNLESQSLWNRAVSSDTKDKQMSNREEKVSIPLEQGSVFRLQWYFEALWHKAYESHFPTFSET